jgi:CBS domain-containing protein
MAKLVRDVMTPGVQTVRLSNTATEAARFMRDADVCSLPVLDSEGRPVGVVTDRDLAMRVIAEGKDPNSTRVEDVYSGDRVAVAPGRTLEEARQVMEEFKVRRLPVVTNEGLVGIVSVADLALEEEHEQTGELLEELSEPTAEPRA